MADYELIVNETITESESVKNGYVEEELLSQNLSSKEEFGYWGLESSISNEEIGTNDSLNRKTFFLRSQNLSEVVSIIDNNSNIGGLKTLLLSQNITGVERVQSHGALKQLVLSEVTSTSFTTKLQFLRQLNPLEGIANNIFRQEKLTWEGASTWDSAVSSQGIVHESTPNTDYNDDTIIRKGYPAQTPYLPNETEVFWPFHEDSGSTAYDFSGNNADGSHQGNSIGEIGLLDTTSYGFNTSNYVLGNYDLSNHPSGFSFSVWVNTDGNSDGNAGILFWDETAGYSIIGLHEEWSGRGFEFRMGDGGTITDLASDVTPNAGEWYHIVCTYEENNKIAIYVNGILEGDIGFNSIGDPAPDMYAAEYPLNNTRFSGRIAYPQVFSKPLTQSEVDVLYNTVRGESSLITNTKSFSGQNKPDIDDVQYNLNNGSITLDVVGSPNTANEEIVTQNLDGANSYELDWSNGHEDFRVEIGMNSGSDETTPTLSKVELF